MAQPRHHGRDLEQGHRHQSNLCGRQHSRAHRTHFQRLHEPQTRHVHGRSAVPGPQAGPEVTVLRCRIPQPSDRLPQLCKIHRLLAHRLHIKPIRHQQTDIQYISYLIRPISILNMGLFIFATRFFGIATGLRIHVSKTRRNIAARTENQNSNK